jgi:hypothetical protein
MMLPALMLYACGSRSGGLGMDGGRPDGAAGAGGSGGAQASDGAASDLAASLCDLVPSADGLTLHVDPVSGDDQATGSGTQSGGARAACALRSLTRATSLATAADKKSMKIVIDVSTTIGSLETFPIKVPGNTTIAPAQGAVVSVLVGAGDGFSLSNAGAILDALILDGQDTAVNGIVVTAGTPASPNVVSGVEVKGFTSAGVRASGAAVLTLTAGANLHENGTATAAASAGLLATDTAIVTVNGEGANELHPTQLSLNAARGIEVLGQAQVNLTGTPSALTAGAGTVVVTMNGLDGVWVEQLLVASAATPPQGMTMTGLVSTLNGGSGMHLFGGSGVKVRGSYLSKNTLHGVHVQTDPAFINGGAGANDGNTITRLDFGVAGDPGHDVLQDDANPNAMKGVCLELTGGGGLGGMLALEGNVFASGGSRVDCASIAGSLPATNECGTMGPLGDVGRNPRNDFDVAQCTVP